jgi:hypothetical protein
MCGNVGGYMKSVAVRVISESMIHVLPDHTCWFSFLSQVYPCLTVLSGKGNNLMPTTVQ